MITTPAGEEFQRAEAGKFGERRQRQSVRIIVVLSGHARCPSGLFVRHP
jgi:hypothetical protein